MTLIQAKDWSTPPWNITGERLSNWRRFIWRERHKLYIKEFGDRQQRQMDEMRNQING